MLVTQYLARDLFKSKTVFVTGGGSGINLGVARNFAALGANVAICGRSQEKLDAAAGELSALGAKVFPVVATCAISRRWKRLLSEARTSWVP
jgi:NAD(P)-dependent dehydrogenase (short-subunit alcohol dehydrogenase family)